MDAAGTDAPRASWLGERVHRPSDPVRLGAAVAGPALLVPGTVLVPAVAEAVADAADAVPSVPPGPARALLSIASVGASLAVLGLLVTVAVDAVRGRRPAVVTAVLGCLLGLVLAAVAERLGDASGGVVAHALTGPTDDAALVPVTAATALFVGVDLDADADGSPRPGRRCWSRSPPR